ncbi:MAG: MMPL family transporter, partial [Dysgonamonadaceae bacterium]
MKKISQLATKHPWLILSAILIVTVYFTVQMMNNSRLETDLDEYMPQTHPAFMYSDSAEAIFNIKDGILIALENKNGIYNTNTLRKVKELTKALQDMKEIERGDVNSLYEAENIVGTDGALDVTPFYDEVPDTPEALEKLRNNVRSNEIVYGRIVSNDETVTILTAEIEDDVFSIDFYNKLLDTAKDFEDEENAIYIAGKPIVEGTLVFLAPKDMQQMVPIVVLVIIIVLFIALRSIKTTLLTLLGVVLSIIWAFGLMAAVGVPIYSVATILPVMLIAMGVAYAIHLFNHLKIFL